MAKIALEDVLNAFIEQYAASLNTAIPGRIITYDPETQKATVQPTIQRVLNSGDIINPQPIAGVPVIFPSGNSGILSFPIVPNDKVLLVFSQRSIDRWVFGKGEDPINPRDRRKHDRADCVAIAGLYPYAKALGSYPTQTVLRHNATENLAENPGEHSLTLHPTGESEGVSLKANKYSDQLSSITMYQDGSIIITSDEGNSLKSEIKMNPDGSVLINANNGTSINMTQGGDIVIDSPTQVQVNCATADVNASTIATIDAPQVHLNGAGGGILTTESINPLTGTPFPSGSTTVKAGDG